MIKLFLVDDHTILREALRSKFEQAPDVEVVGDSDGAGELVEILAAAKPGVIILDMKLQRRNGIMMIRGIRNVLPKCKIVILTMYDHVRYVVHALESGADGFVVKGASFDELLQAVRHVAAGKTYVSSSMTSKLAAHLKKGRKPGSLESLSQREFEVLVRIGSGLGLKQIAAELGVSEKSVTTYRARIFEKLDLNCKADLIRYTLEAGLID